MTRRPGTTTSRVVQVLGLALAVLGFVALAGPGLDVGADLGATADAGPLPQRGAATTTGGGAAGPGGPGAAAGSGSVPEGPPPEVAADGVRLVSQTDWLEDGQPFELVLEVGDEVGPDASLVVDLHAPVTSRSQFAATLDGELLGSRRAEHVIPLAEVPEAPDGTRRIRLTPGPTDAPGERALRALPRAGVYPLVVGVRPADPDVEPPDPFVTYLVRTPSETTTPLQVAVVQPFDSDVAQEPDGTTTLDAATLEQLQGIADVLAASDGAPLTLTPRPETLDALRRLADTAADPRAATASAVLQALETAARGRQVVSGPFVDVTLDALEAAGLGDEVAAQRRRGDQVVDEVLDVTTDVRTWVEDDGVSPRALRRLAGLGVDRIVLPDEALSPVNLRLSLARPFSVTGGGQGFELDATSPDPALSARYADADPVLAAQHLLADLAVLHGDEPGPLRPRGIVVAPPTGTDTDPVLLERLLEGLAGSPILDPVTLDTYFDRVDPEGGVEETLVRDLEPAAGALGITAADVEAARARLQGFTAIVANGARPERPLGDLTLIAQADGLDPAERRAYLAAVGERIDRRLGGIGIVEGASFRLPDSEGTIPLTIVRDEGEPLSVRVVLESDKLAFEDAPNETDGRVEYQIDLESENTPLVVPVRVRSPGTFPLLVTITSPDGQLEIVRRQVTVRSTAFSGVGVALSVGAGAFLLLWWARHWRTVRRSRNLVPVA